MRDYNDFTADSCRETCVCSIYIIMRAIVTEGLTYRNEPALLPFLPRGLL